MLIELLDHRSAENPLSLIRILLCEDVIQNQNEKSPLLTWGLENNATSLLRTSPPTDFGSGHQMKGES